MFRISTFSARRAPSSVVLDRLCRAEYHAETLFAAAPFAVSLMGSAPTSAEEACISRRRLVAAVEQGLKSGGVTIVGAHGTGKTTLLREALGNLGLGGVGRVEVDFDRYATDPLEALAGALSSSGELPYTIRPTVHDISGAVKELLGRPLLVLVEHIEAVTDPSKSRELLSALGNVVGLRSYGEESRLKLVVTSRTTSRALRLGRTVVEAKDLSTEEAPGVESELSQLRNLVAPGLGCDWVEEEVGLNPLLARAALEQAHRTSIEDFKSQPLLHPRLANAWKRVEAWVYSLSDSTLAQLVGCLNSGIPVGWSLQSKAFVDAFALGLLDDEGSKIRYPFYEKALRRVLT